MISNGEKNSFYVYSQNLVIKHKHLLLALGKIP